jgi:hypothetical protein
MFATRESTLETLEVRPQRTDGAGRTEELAARGASPPINGEQRTFFTSRRLYAGGLLLSARGIFGRPISFCFHFPDAEQ